MTGLFQGLAIMFFAAAMEHDIGWAKSALFYIPYLSMAVILPVLYLLLRPQKESGRLGIFLAGSATVLLITGLSFGWNFADIAARGAGGDFFVYGVSVAVLAYIALPFLQSFQTCGNPFDYSRLYLFAGKTR